MTNELKKSLGMIMREEPEHHSDRERLESRNREMERWRDGGRERAV